MEYQEQSLGGQIFNRIRNDILSGNYAPGEELKEATLGKQLGVSRTPVREALRQLDLEGLVEIAPNRGAKVIGISRKDVEDIYHMRARLEGLAARKAAENIKEEELDALTKDMDNIIAFAETISTAQCEQTNFDNINNLTNVLREDVVVPSYDREEILKNAESQDEGYFLVKRRS